MTGRSEKRDEDQSGGEETDQIYKADKNEAVIDASYEELRAINESLVLTGVRLMERVEIAEEEQRVALAAGQEEERRRLSRELHDQTGQHLTGLALGLESLGETIRKEFAPNSRAEAKLRDLHRLATELARDLHRIAVELRPTSLDDLGLIPALESYVEHWSEEAGIPVHFGSFGLDESRLPEMGTITVYRVVQEALTNILRYASSASTGVPGEATVGVTLQGFGDYLQVTIEDDGPGFDTEARQHSSRLGIAGMRERAALCRGTLHIESEPGEGTAIYLRIPLTPKSPPV